MTKDEKTRRIEGQLALGRRCQAGGDFAGALAAARAAVAMDARDSAARLFLVEALVQSGESDEGMREIRRLESDAENDPLLLQHVARLYTHLNRHEEAARCSRRAVSLAPGNAQFVYNFATALIALGRLDEAESALDQVVRLAPGDADAYYNRATLRKQSRDRNHIAETEAALGRCGAKGEVALNYALAKELEDIGESARAFSHLKRGAGARRRVLSYRVEDDVETMADVAAAFDAGFFAVPRAGHEDARPVFIVGLPRSGTTLVDRILSSHPAVESLGEISNFAVALVRQAGPGAGGKRDLVRRSAKLDFGALGSAYCGSIEALGDAVRLVDKTPVNFLYLGLIAAALPKAHIIHVRRGAMDVCYAMYKTLFRMAYPFSYDLGDLGRYFAAYHGLMRHWRGALPGRFLEVDYEDLVTDQERVSREIVKHCGLEWDDACLSFHRNAAPSLTASAAQVRQPIYRSSVGLWRRYEAELAPLKEFLMGAGIDLEKTA